MVPQDILLLVFAAVLLAGGVMGWVKARSAVSLIVSGAFALLLILVGTGVLKTPWLAEITLAALAVSMGARFAKSRRFMPAGLITLLAVVVLALRFVL